MSIAKEGTVKSIRKDRKAFKLSDAEVWYSVFNESEMGDVQRGNQVTFKYTEKGDWKNIVKDTLVITAATTAPSGGKSGGGYSGGGDKQFRSVPELTRIDALSQAITTVNAHAGELKGDVKTILSLADVYVGYIEGRIGAAAGAATAPAAQATADPEAEAQAAAEAARVAAEAAAKEAAAKAAAEAAAAASGQSALDSFMG